MAASVKPIEAKSVHQIQSGQVIVDLCSVVKELVENSLDANADAIEVRFKNNGLDEIEIQDNGTGISSANYESVALKHYTSKLSTYDDLASLETFGFRGEALSSLCALSNFSISTAQADEAPKGHRLEFEISGKLKGTTVVACQKGTTATVQNLFDKLPVRRKELAKHIKREYGKVLGLLHAYACISTNVKFTVKNAMPKAKSVTIFATKSNATTRENIANVYGAKTLAALAPLDLNLDFEQSLPQPGRGQPQVMGVRVCGHISKPVFGEGRQTPDRQMFFVNGRPCGLPQIAKAINEVYKSFNVSQSPFIFADFQMDTGAYDVNVSPDKRTIFLHNAAALIESLKDSLTEMFDQHDQTVPQSHIKSSKLPSFKQLSLPRDSSNDTPGKSFTNNQASPAGSDGQGDDPSPPDTLTDEQVPNRLLRDHFRNLTSTREQPTEGDTDRDRGKLEKNRQRRATRVAKILAAETPNQIDEYGNVREGNEQAESELLAEDDSDTEDVHVKDFNARMAEQQEHRRDSPGKVKKVVPQPEDPIPSLLQVQRSEGVGVVQNAFDRMRPRRLSPEVATITIGDKTITRVVGSHSVLEDQKAIPESNQFSHKPSKTAPQTRFVRGLQRFNAPGTQPEAIDNATETEEGDEADLEALEQPETNFDDSEANLLRSAGSDSSEDLPQPHVPRHISHDISLESIEDEEKAAERIRVSELIRFAEAAAISKQGNQGQKRAAQALKTRNAKDSIVSLQTETEIDLEQLEAHALDYLKVKQSLHEIGIVRQNDFDATTSTVEEQLSLTVSKTDFAAMQVVGQFNLGFILAVRSKHDRVEQSGSNDRDELFIIDQHASDEKYNFERLQAETVVGHQRMVRPAILDLTAVEEEIVIENQGALEKNGFIVEVDMSGEHSVGQRCRLISLPLSKEVVFGTKDLDELIHLLAEAPMLNDSSPVPRPSKVRKMFAMRACRSSIMIGKTLSEKQMSGVLEHMGSIDKPWNCPHGRPTMRHLATLDTLESSLWTEGDGVYLGDVPGSVGAKPASEIWRTFAAD